MKLLVQHTRRNPQDWEESSSAAWASLPKRPLPHGELGGQDNNPGWTHRLNIQGVSFEGDHYAVEDLPNGACRVYAWYDDKPEGEKFAQVYIFLPLAPDARLGGAINTRQSQVIYAQADVMARWTANGPLESTEFRSWEEFVPPPEIITRHGVWTSDQANLDHEAVQEIRGWREWTEGLDPKELDERGQVKDQRAQGRYDKPKGTKTYYQSDTALATGLHIANNEDQLNTGTAVSATLGSGNFAGGASRTTHCWTTGANQPNSAAWPTGTYRCQLDCTATGAGMTYGLRTAGTVAGHFARVASDLSSELETKAQVEALFNGTTGLKLATTGSVSWTAGAVGDRFECLVGGTRAASTGNQSYTLRVNLADDYADGPWVTTVTGSIAADAVLKKTQTSSVSADSVLKKTQTGSILADATLKKTALASILADAILKAVGTTNSVSANAILKQTLTASFSADASLVLRILGSFSADANLKKAIVAQILADAILKKSIEALIQADAVLKAAQAGSITANSALKAVQSGQYSADAVIRKVVEQAFASDATLKKTILAQVSADATLRLVVTGQFVAAAILNKTVLASLVADAILKKSQSAGVTVDSVLLKVIVASLPVDATLKKQFTASLAADSVLLKAITATFPADAILNKTWLASFLADAILQKSLTGSFTADAVLAGGGSILADFLADAVLRKTGITAQVLADAVLLKQGILSGVSADAVLRQAGITSALFADAVLRRAATADITVEAILQKAVASFVSADAIIKREGWTASIAADAVLLASFVASFTADASILKRTTAQIVADAVLQAQQLGSATANAILLKTKTDAITVDAVLSSFLKVLASLSIDACLAKATSHFLPGPGLKENLGRNLRRHPFTPRPKLGDDRFFQ